MITDRKAFSDRLIAALEAARIPTGPTSVARHFNLITQGKLITVHAARKWLVGEAIPTQGKLVELAGMLGADVQWLRFGGVEVKLTKPALSVEQRELGALLSKLTPVQCRALSAVARTMGGAA